jgi:predicted nucleic acid-binding protein
MMETYVNITRKAKVGLPLQEAFEYVRAFTEWPVIETTPNLVLEALDLSQRSMISPWDAGIVAAARQAGCKTVLSEDLGDGQAYGGITVKNPFAATVR